MTACRGFLQRLSYLDIETSNLGLELLDIFSGPLHQSAQSSDDLPAIRLAAGTGADSYLIRGARKNDVR